MNLTRVTNDLTKLNSKTSSICIWFPMRSTYSYGRNLSSSRSQAIHFEIFKDKFPKYFAEIRKVPFIKSYLVRQLLRRHAFPMIDCSQVAGIQARTKQYASQP